MFTKTTKILAAIFGTCATATIISGMHDRKVHMVGEIEEPVEIPTETTEEKTEK